MQIINHKMVGDGVLRYDMTSKTSGLYATGSPDTIIIHYTAGEDREVAVNVLKDPNVRASAHMVVGLQGEIVQLADLNVITWHAGTSSYVLPTDTTRATFNKYSIGIEISNPGYLTKVGNDFLTWYNKKIPPEIVIEAKHRHPLVCPMTYWYKYPDVQLKRVYEICQAIIKTYPSIKYILGHEEICPTFKTDLGPAFPLEDLRLKMGVWIPPTDRPLIEKPKEIITGWVYADYIEMDNTDSTYDAYVKVEKLNIRTTAQIIDNNLAGKPLKKGDKLKILELVPGWMKVIAERA
jgi:N-acetylmuramoyl-L-alanine amidase